jgi:hypothetical protein
MKKILFLAATSVPQDTLGPRSDSTPTDTTSAQ